MSISRTTICVFVALSIISLGKANVICVEKPNGCSVPTWTFYFVSTNKIYMKVFEEDCNRHDLCYSCVSTSCLNASNWDLVYKNIQDTVIIKKIVLLWLFLFRVITMTLAGMYAMADFMTI